MHLDWIGSRTRRDPLGYLAWLTATAIVGFLAPFASTDLASLPRAWFVLVHVGVTGTFLTAFARWAGFDLAELRRNWPLGLAGAALAAAFSVRFVLSQPASPGPQGFDLARASLWLGVIYGMTDALLLTVLPVISVWSIFRSLGWLHAPWGWVGAPLLSMIASAGVTAAYHLGFPEFRGPDLLQPVIGNAVFTLAYVLSGSPLAPMLAHIALHLAAIIHAPGTSVVLPPHS